MRRLAPGTSISHYEIVEEIGAGGMGVVYKAEDTKLKRHVALKFLPPYLTQDPGAKQRFMQEARAASSLDHNNICAIHEIDETGDGQMFISMACYEGESLRKRIERGSMELDEALDMALQISEGLAKAHSKGIVHRDIKPANIMITGDGVAKIMDFGLAKLAGQTRITRTGTTMGTVAYMSPEQAQGREVDERSDIFSLGVVLYEMVTGRSPFKADYEAAALYSIVNEEPVPLSHLRPGVPEQLQQIVDKALSKDVSTRYQSTADLMADIRSLREGRLAGVTVGRRAEARRRKIMLVVFTVVAAVALTASLSHYILPERASSFLRGLIDWGRPGASVSDSQDEAFVVVVAPFWGTTDKAKEEGKVMQALIDRQLRTELTSEPSVTIVSEDVSDVPRSHEDAEVLGETYDAALVIWGEVLALHDEVEIQPYLTYLKRQSSPSEPILAGFAANLAEPSQLTLRKAEAEEIGDVALLAAARYYMMRAPDKALAIVKRISPPTSESLRLEAGIARVQLRVAEAESLYFEAASVDSSDPWPHWALVWLYQRQGRYDAAVSQAEQGLAVDPENVRMCYALASAYIAKGEGDKAISLFENHVAQKPADAETHVLLGWLYERLRRYQEAVEEYGKAINLNPENPDAYYALGFVYDMQDSLDQATANYREAIRLQGTKSSDFGTGYGAHVRLAWIYSRRGMHEEAVSESQKAIALAPTQADGYYPLIRNLSALGRSEDAIEQIRTYIARYPDRPNLRVVLGKLFYDLGRPSDAIAEYMEALRLKPDHGDAYYSLGQVYELGDSLDQAVLNYEQAIRVGTNETSAGAPHLALGKVYSKQGRYDEAVREVQEAITLSGAYVGTYSALADIHLREGKYEEVIKAAQQAIALYPKHAYSHVRMGAAYAFQGEYEEAISAFRQAVDADSEEVYYHLWYSLALARGGRLQEAKTHLAQVSETFKGESWETSLVRFYIGEIDEDALLKLAESEDAKTAKGQKCEAYYYIGMAYLLGLDAGLESASPDTAAAREYFGRCLATDAKSFTEYMFAENELALLQAGKPEE